MILTQNEKEYLERFLKMRKDMIDQRIKTIGSYDWDTSEAMIIDGILMKLSLKETQPKNNSIIDL